MAQSKALSLLLIFALLSVGSARGDGSCVLVFPASESSLGVFELISFELENTPGVETVPFDLALKLRQTLAGETKALLQYADYTGVRYLLTGDVVVNGDGVAFQGVLRRTDGKKWPLEAVAPDAVSMAAKIAGQALSALGAKAGAFAGSYTANSQAADLYQLGMVYKNRGNFNRAASLFESAVDLAPEFALGKLRMAECYEVNGRINRSRELLESLTFPQMTPLELIRLEILFKTYRDQRKMEAARQTLGAAIELAQARGLHRRQAGLMLTQSLFWLADNRNDEEARRWADAALRQSVILENKREQANAKLVLARIAVQTRQPDYFDRARSLIEEAKATAFAIGARQSYAAALHFEAALLAAGPRLDQEEALARFDAAAREFEAIGSVYSLWHARLEKAKFLSRYGRHDEAAEIYRDLRSLAKEHGFFRSEINLENMFAMLHLRTGNAAEAVRLLEQNMQLLTENPIPSLIRRTFSLAIAAYLEQGEPKMALAVSARLVAQEEQFGEPGILSYVLNNHGEALFMLGRDEEALTFYERSLTIKKELGNPVDIAWTMRNIAAVWLARNELDQVVSALEDCELYDAGSLKNGVLQARLLYAQGDANAARRLLDRLSRKHVGVWNENLKKLQRNVAGARKNERISQRVLPNYL